MLKNEGWMQNQANDCVVKILATLNDLKVNDQKHAAQRAKGEDKVPRVWGPESALNRNP